MAGVYGCNRPNDCYCMCAKCKADIHCNEHNTSCHKTCLPPAA